MNINLHLVSQSLILVVVIATNFKDADDVINHVVSLGQQQYDRVCHQLRLGEDYPDFGYLNGTKWTIHSKEDSYWTMGFFPGVLWHLYEQSHQNSTWLERALNATEGVYEQQFNVKDHDVGFKILSSYGEAYRLLGKTSYIPIIVQAADSLSSRFNEKVGCIRSWGAKTDDENFLVIVDNMMNLDVLWKAYEFTKNETYKSIAISHANRTSQEHVRKDFSSFQVVNFDPNTGKVQEKYDKQGFSNESCWSRGESWLITGYTHTYKSSGIQFFLDMAQNLAKYFIEKLSKKVPNVIAPYDLDPHPNPPSYIPPDVSATMVATLGFYELYELTNNTTYLNVAHSIIQSIMEGGFLLENPSVARFPAILANSTVSKQIPNVASITADYYFLKLLPYIKKYYNYKPQVSNN